MIRKTIKGGDFKSQMVGELVFDQVPEEGSFNPVTSDAVAKIAGGVDGIQVDVDSIKGKIPEKTSEIVSQQMVSTIRYGSNLLSEEAVSLGTGWSGDLDTGIVHSGASTDPVTFTTATTSGKPYLVQLTLSSASASVGVSIGDSDIVDVYNGTRTVAIGIFSDGGSLKITPLMSNLSITITEIKLCEISENGDNELIVYVENVAGDQMQKNLTGFWNIAIDETSLAECENGSRNIAIGRYALKKLVTGTRNIAIGTFALPWATYANGNVAIGADVVYNVNSNGTYKPVNNVAVGFGALQVGSGTENNVAIGTSAMAAAPSDATKNACVGMQSGNYCKTYNAFVGYRAGYYTRGSQNVGVGGSAGGETYITGDGNVSIGYNAGPKSDTASAANPVTMNDTISIGRNVRATKSNQIVIGSTTHTELVIMGNKKILFNLDGTVTWEEIE